MRKADADLLQAGLQHLVSLARYSRGQALAMRRLLLKAEDDLFARLFVALGRLDAGSFSVRRLEEALADVEAATRRLYAEARTETEREAARLVQAELDFNAAATRAATGGAASPAVPSPSQVFAAATERPMRGRLLSSWFDALPANRARRVRDSLATGFVEGRTVDEMVRTLRGTRAQAWKDGLVEVDRRDAEAVVRTATSHYAAAARRDFYAANNDLFSRERWVSTLDGRTSEACQVRDGLLYTCPGHDPVGHDVPWLGGPGELHWNCRSVSVPELDATEALGIDLPPLQRASVSGPVDGRTSYADWIRSQPASVQDDVLGPTRARLMRDGRMPFDRFFDDRGRHLTLDELRDRDAEFFRRAGL